MTLFEINFLFLGLYNRFDLGSFCRPGSFGFLLSRRAGFFGFWVCRLLLRRLDRLRGHSRRFDSGLYRFFDLLEFLRGLACRVSGIKVSGESAVGAKKRTVGNLVAALFAFYQ